MERVLIVGVSCSGKTTFTDQLKKRSDFKNHFCAHIDEIYWDEDWTPRDKHEFLKDVKDILRKEKWIIDGNYYKCFDAEGKTLLLNRATHVINLHLPSLVIFYRGIRRVIRRVKSKEQVSNKNVETLKKHLSLKNGIPAWLLGYPRQRKEYKYFRSLGQSHNIIVQELKSVKSVEKFLKEAKCY